MFKQFHGLTLVFLATLTMSCGSSASSNSCTDGIMNGTESGIDCGGGSCPACGTGQGCLADSDCATGVCSSGTCIAPSCTDHVKDGTETGMDCGGGSCSACGTGQGCLADGDCQSGVCSGGTCAAASCTDHAKNGSETDVDCGGSCSPCANNGACQLSTDCQSMVCTGHVCQVPSCTDHVKNGNETGADCGGGTCPGCSVGTACNASTDCAGSLCVTKLCTYAPSCNALYTAVPTTPSGAYMIQPAGQNTAFSVYCDMVDNGGGWTLALKIDGTQADHAQQSFSYDSALWTNTTTLNDTTADLSVMDAKFASFSTVPFTQVMGVMTAGNATPNPPFAATNTITFTPAGTWASLQSLMQQPVNTVVLYGPNAPANYVAQWTNLTVPAATPQVYCNWIGVNMESGNCGGFSPSAVGRVRIGLLTNQENDCCSPDSWVGFGGEYTAPYCYPTTPWYGPSAGSAGGNAACSGGGDVQNMGYVFVR